MCPIGNDDQARLQHRTHTQRLVCSYVVHLPTPILSLCIGIRQHYGRNNNVKVKTYDWLNKIGQLRTLWCHLEDTVLLFGTVLLFSPKLFPKYEA